MYTFFIPLCTIYFSFFKRFFAFFLEDKQREGKSRFFHHHSRKKCFKKHPSPIVFILFLAHATCYHILADWSCPFGDAEG